MRNCFLVWSWATTNTNGIFFKWLLISELWLVDFFQLGPVTKVTLQYKSYFWTFLQLSCERRSIEKTIIKNNNNKIFLLLFFLIEYHQHSPLWEYNISSLADNNDLPVRINWNTRTTILLINRMWLWTYKLLLAGGQKFICHLYNHYSKRCLPG